MNEAAWNAMTQSSWPSTRDLVCNALPTRESMWLGLQAMTTLVSSAPSTVLGVFSNCFSRARRMQFDQDQKRSLLNNLYHDEARVNIRDAEMESAALELRRRIQKMEYEKHKRMEHDQAQKKKEEDVIDLNPNEEPEFTTPLKAADIRKMSVDQLLSMDELQKTLPPSSSSSLESGRLRKWLAEIDVNKSMEYVAYAIGFEKQGFFSLKDIALIEEDDVEQALTEVGVSKFAHRARLRKAILRLQATP
ncbi:hypothetical protein THRCLA_00209 [Thraustotheca clavata]|uniref:SAM domain-containing protein n=1 Tax=Thraustotheca clavata TaxID=74557 RepID=A0A1W0ABY1_9STRA|nr:hypothetical protein THRCLA_00209 [Thraustotheca clavata]